ncbi:MAG: TonB-dependent receptor [bacterium]
MRAEGGDQPIRAARVFVRGRPGTAITDAQGRFSVALPAGPQVLSVIHPDFSRATAEVQVAEGAAPIVVRLAPAAVALDDLEVVAPYIEGGVAALVAERQGQSAVVDVIGAEQMARSGDGDAASALKRVTGLTVVGGKYVYVRGMGERYSTTLLDGVTLPSPEPERRVVPLDLFPTGLLGSVVVQKTYSPDMPGEFGGGVVQLRTRRPGDEPVFEVSLSATWRPDTTGREGLTYAGGATDFLGFDDGTRALPEAVRAASEDQILLERTRLSTKGFTAAELDALGEAMPNRWATATLAAPPGLGVDVVAGDRLVLGGAKLSGLATLGWGQDWRMRDFRRSYNIVGQGGALELQHSYRFEALERTVGLTGAVGLTAELGPDHELASTSLVLRLTDDETRVFAGRNRDAGTDIRVTRLRFIERMLVAEILRGAHQLHPFDLQWHYAYALADRQEPDRRTYRYDREPGTDTWLLSDRPEGNQRLYSDLDDANHDLALALRFAPEREAGREPAQYVKVGGQAVVRDRGVDTRRYKFQTKGPRAGDPALISQDPEQIFVPANIGTDAFQFQETTRQTDNYTADQRLLAGYVMAETPIFGLRLMAGLRVEAFRQRVTTFELFNPDQAPVEAKLDDTDLLPAASLTWPFAEGWQARLGFGRTVSRPDFREMSPATFNDVTGGDRSSATPTSIAPRSSTSTPASSGTLPTREPVPRPVPQGLRSAHRADHHPLGPVLGDVRQRPRGHQHRRRARRPRPAHRRPLLAGNAALIRSTVELGEAASRPPTAARSRASRRTC